MRYNALTYYSIGHESGHPWVRSGQVWVGEFCNTVGQVGLGATGPTWIFPVTISYCQRLHDECTALQQALHSLNVTCQHCHWHAFLFGCRQSQSHSTIALVSLRAGMHMYFCLFAVLSVSASVCGKRYISLLTECIYLWYSSGWVPT